MKNIKNEIQARQKEEDDNWEIFFDHDTCYYSEYRNEIGYPYFQEYAVKQKFNQLMLIIYKKNHILESDFNLLDDTDKLEYYKDALELYVNNEDEYNGEDKWMSFLLKKSFINRIKEINNNKLDEEVMCLLDINNIENMFYVEKKEERFVINVDIYSYGLLFRDAEINNMNHDISILSRLSCVETILTDIKVGKNKVSFKLEKDYQIFGIKEIEELFDILLKTQLNLEFEQPTNVPYIFIAQEEVEELIFNFFREKKLILKINDLDMSNDKNMNKKRKI